MPRGWWKVGEREKSARPWMERSFPVRSRSADIGCRTSPSTDLFAFNYVLRWLLANCLPLPAHYLSRTTERSCRDALRSKSRLKGNYTIQGFLSVKKKKKRKKIRNTLISNGSEYLRHFTMRFTRFLATFEGGRLLVALLIKISCTFVINKSISLRRWIFVANWEFLNFLHG